MATQPRKDEVSVVYSGEAYVQRPDGLIEKVCDFSILSPDTLDVLGKGAVVFDRNVNGLVAACAGHLLADIRGLEGNRDPHRLLRKFIGRKMM